MIAMGTSRRKLGLPIAILAAAIFNSAHASGDMCFSNDGINVVTLKGRLAATDHPWNDKSSHKQSFTAYSFEPSLGQFVETLEKLDSDWRTPEDIWPEDAIAVNLKIDQSIVCQIVYSKNELFAQTKSSGAFLVRPLYEFEAKQINDALFSTVEGIR